MSHADDATRNAAVFNRRDFVRLGAAGLGVALGGASLAAHAADPRETAPAAAWPLVNQPLKRVRVGFVGAGGMGTNHIRNLLRIPGVELCAVCDIVESKVKNVQELARKAGQKKPKGYSRGPLDFKRMCEKEDLDLVYTATPWEWHVPVCVAAMENGKHACTEVPAAVTLEECWQLVETAEKQQKHCLMMENCNYNRFELLTLNLVRKGLLGDVVYGAGGYCHDLRDVTLDSLAVQIGMVTQETHLFHDTIRTNLLYARLDATQTELESACHAANIALLLGRKVIYDPVKNEFVGDEQANRLRSEALREPWRI